MRTYRRCNVVHDVNDSSEELRIAFSEVLVLRFEGLTYSKDVR